MALALERSLECRIYPRLELARPILDLGCGEGLFAHILFQEKIDTGIDPNPRELERAQQLGAYSELIQCFGDKIPKPDASYNTVFSNSVLEHIPDLAPVLREVHRLLAPGGRFFVTVPSDLFEQNTWINRFLMTIGLSGLAVRFRRFFNSFWRHYHCYPLDKWKQVMQQAGFEVIDAYTYNPARTCLLNDFLVPFSFPSLVLKRLANRWVLFPGLRRILLMPVRAAVRPLLHGAEKAERGGLVFLALRKAKT
jgi:SAM-dependent methyltransferase